MSDVPCDSQLTDPKQDGPLAAVSRRQFLQVVSTAAGGLMLSIRVPLARGEDVAEEDDEFKPNAFIRIGADGWVILTMPYVEMGQGTYTSIPMLVAEELEVELNQVQLEHAPPDEANYGNPLLAGVQATGNSNSIRAAWEPLRRAGAVARTMLVAAAAARWGVDSASCRAQSGTVLHVPSGQRLSYGEIASDAAKLPIPQDVPLKQPSQFRLIGTAARRLDTPAKVDGSAVYGIDVQPPNVKFATLKQSPVFGGRVKSLDDSMATKVVGVRQVIKLEDTVAVVADHMGAAIKGLAALQIEWEDGPNASIDTQQIVSELEVATLRSGAVAQSIGDVDRAMEAAAFRLEATYQVPFLAHAALEPMNCTVHLQENRCDVWVGTQVAGRAQAAAAATAGLPLQAVFVHNHLIGGGFGRRLEVDGIIRAVQIAKYLQEPVKVVWTREEDIQHDMYRPHFLDRISAGLNEQGQPVAWKHRFAGSSILARWLPAAFNGGIDQDTVEGAINLPYSFPNSRVEYQRVEPAGIQTAFWRSVGPSHNVFVVESFVDELAAAAGEDPVAFRLALLTQAPRAKAVLQLAAEHGDWGAKLPPRVGRGVSLQHAFGTYLSQVVEAEAAEDGTVHVKRVVCAVDCGLIVNPDTVKAQIQGAIIFGLTAALYGKITVRNGRVHQGNFNNYRILRMNEVPAIEVHILKSEEAPGGIGEAGTSAIAPALTNAIHAATGIRLRKLPIDDSALRSA
jgi:isoquinoline 1-oxidoreductase beta subunit